MTIAENSKLCVCKNVLVLFCQLLIDCLFSILFFSAKDAQNGFKFQNINLGFNMINMNKQ